MESLFLITDRAHEVTFILILLNLNTKQREGPFHLNGNKNDMASEKIKSMVDFKLFGQFLSKFQVHKNHQESC